MIFFPLVATGYELMIKNDRISIQADQVLLQTLLMDISRQTGIKIRIEPDINPLITARMNNRAMEPALKSMIDPLNHVMKWERNISRNTDVVRLTEIHIFNRGTKDQMIALNKDRTLDIAQNPEDGSFYVKNEILLRLEKKAAVQQLDRILDQIGGLLISKYPEINLYRIKLPKAVSVLDLIEKLSSDTRIEKAEPNYAYPISQPYKYILDQKIPNEPHSDKPPGHALPIAVLDTGWLPGSMPDNFHIQTKNALDPDQPVSDPLGHGTQMVMVAAGFIRPLGVEIKDEPSNPVVAIRAFDKNGFMSSDIFIRSINYALESNAKVVSMSWGSNTKSDFTGDIINYGASRGLIFVASAGNKPTGKPVYPAAYKNVISVGALAPDGTPWKNSNHGHFVDGYIPGFAQMPVGYLAEPGIYAGTSISAAYAANRIAAFISQNPEETQSIISTHLFEHKEPVLPVKKLKTLP